MAAGYLEGDPILDLLRFGLSRAIQADSEGVRARFPQIQLDLDLVDDEGLLAEEGNRALFAVYREAVEHAVARQGTTRVWVKYLPSPHGMQLEVKDDGQNTAKELADFIPDEVVARVHAAGGKLGVSAGAEKKTRVQARMRMAE